MNLNFKEQFITRWEKYVGNSELPLIFYYADEVNGIEPAPMPESHHCLICDLLPIRQGKSRYFDKDRISCGGGQRYLGFAQDLRPQFEYFLSCGIPGKLEGERYKKSPALVKAHLKFQPPFTAPGKYIVFKRWDHLTADDQPLVVIFLAQPDVLAGLFTLANYDASEPQGVIAPFGSGCSSIVFLPYQEQLSENPRAVLGMFDVSARPYVPTDVLTFSIPWKKFVPMVENMEESFLITKSWQQVQRRINMKK